MKVKYFIRNFRTRKLYCWIFFLFFFLENLQYSWKQTCLNGQWLFFINTFVCFYSSCRISFRTYFPGVRHKSRNYLKTFLVRLKIQVLINQTFINLTTAHIFFYSHSSILTYAKKYFKKSYYFFFARKWKHEETLRL